MTTLTTAEAARRLGITRQAVSLLCKRGTLKAEKRGRDWFIEESEVERYKTTRRPAGRPRKEDADGDQQADV